MLEMIVGLFGENKILRNNKIFFPNKIRVAEDEYFTSVFFFKYEKFYNF